MYIIQHFMRKPREFKLNNNKMKPYLVSWSFQEKTPKKRINFVDSVKKAEKIKLIKFLLFTRMEHQPQA